MAKSVETKTHGKNYVLPNGIKLLVEAWPYEIMNNRMRVTGHDWETIRVRVQLGASDISLAMCPDWSNGIDRDYFREELEEAMVALAVHPMFSQAITEFADDIVVALKALETGTAWPKVD